MIVYCCFLVLLIGVHLVPCTTVLLIRISSDKHIPRGVVWTQHMLFVFVWICLIVEVVCSNRRAFVCLFKTVNTCTDPSFIYSTHGKRFLLPLHGHIIWPCKHEPCVTMLSNINFINTHVLEPSLTQIVTESDFHTYDIKSMISERYAIKTQAIRLCWHYYRMFERVKFNVHAIILHHES